MNIALSSRHSVHAAQADGTKVPNCHGFGAPAGAESYRETGREVTCKKCLKLIAAEADREAAYQDRLEASLTPATEAHDYGFVAPAEAAAEQPAEIIETREAARDAAEDARRDAALARAAAKLAEQPYRIARPLAEAAQCICPCTWQCERPADEPCTCPCTCGAQAAAETCGADLFDVTTSTLGTCVLKPGHDAGVLHSQAERLHKTAQMVRDDAHTEALGEHLLIQDPEDIARDLRARVAIRSICTCGHGAHSYGPCHVGPRPLDGGGCDCDIYQPSGLEGVFDPDTDCWGVRPVGSQMATWLPWTPTRGGLARKARVALALKMMRRNG